MSSTIVINQRLVLTVLVGTWLVLCAANAIQHYVILSTGTTEKVWVLDVDFEASFYTWFSVLLLALSALIAFVLASFRGDHRRSHNKAWTAIGLILLAMSMDEMLSFHERLSNVVKSVLPTSGIFTFSWTVPAVIFVAIVAIAFWPFLRSLPTTIARGIFVAGVVFVMGAVGMEMVAGLIVSESETRSAAFDSATYRVVSSIEEALEGLGVILLVRTLLLQASYYAPALFASPRPVTVAPQRSPLVTQG